MPHLPRAYTHCSAFNAPANTPTQRPHTRIHAQNCKHLPHTFHKFWWCTTPINMPCHSGSCCNSSRGSDAQFRLQIVFSATNITVRNGTANLMLPTDWRLHPDNTHDRLGVHMLLTFVIWNSPLISVITHAPYDVATIFHYQYLKCQQQQQQSEQADGKANIGWKNQIRGHTNGNTFTNVVATNANSMRMCVYSQRLTGDL